MKHPFDPVFDKNSEILILGTFPSEKSREYGFFYGHPQNRFWKIIALLTKSNIPQTIYEKKQILLKNRIAVWDTIQSCDIKGSSDVLITNIIPNDLSKILKYTDIKQIYANGPKAYQIYMKFYYQNTEKNIVKLPSTSPANASYNLQKLYDMWKVIL